jgi:hypothetical protein
MTDRWRAGRRDSAKASRRQYHQQLTPGECREAGTVTCQSPMPNAQVKVRYLALKRGIDKSAKE